PLSMSMWDRNATGTGVAGARPEEDEKRDGIFLRGLPSGCLLTTSKPPIRTSVTGAHRLAVRTPPFHGGNRGSIPLGRTILLLPMHDSAGDSLETRPLRHEQLSGLHVPIPKRNPSC